MGGLVRRLVVISNVERNDMPVPWMICCFVDQCVVLPRHAYVNVLLMTSFKLLICCKSV